MKPLKPVPVYYLLTFGQSFLLALVAVVNLVFQAEAGLSPLQLVLVGTVQEATIFLCEVPTGMVADIYSRRLSVLLGFAITGAGLMLIGSFSRFETILIGSAVWGLGFTFISGALQAWISDEIGTDKVGPVFVRASQVELLGRIAAIPVGVGIALWQELSTPILIAGALLILLALVLSVVMPETGFKRAPGTTRSRVSLPQQTKTTVALVSASPLLMTIFGIALFYGMTSEGFDRLWTAHFLRDLGLPMNPSSINLAGTSLVVEPIIWFGFIRMVGTFLALGGSELARRKLDFNGNRVPHWLFAINAGQAVSLVVLALAGGFWLGVAAMWTATTLSRVYDPLYLGWLNRNVRSEVRATVLSMSGQADAFGQIAGGPVIGAIGSVVSLRAALGATAAAILPALALYLRAFNLGPVEDVKPVEIAAGAGVVTPLEDVAGPEA